jgi:hypothetical protein
MTAPPIEGTPAFSKMARCCPARPRSRKLQENQIGAEELILVFQPVVIRKAG